eukprot:m.73354 g.73354  ORF g.73354 m.73354 type:complete len:473 (+) comp24548_c0_seq1:136-1554(+)
MFLKFLFLSSITMTMGVSFDEVILGNVTCEYVSSALSTGVLCDGKMYEQKAEATDSRTIEFYEYVGICVSLVLGAGIFSGLSLGLLSLDKNHLQVLAEQGHANEKRYAQGLLLLCQHHHLLLVTLLLANAGVNEALPLFVDKLVPSPVYTILISVTALLIFGEIIPQALCSRYGLAIGYYFIWFVYVAVFILFPIAWPMAKLLDYLLGHCEGAYFRRAELISFANLHQRKSIGNEEPLMEDEVTIIQGTLSMHSHNVKQHMTRLENAYMLEDSTGLNEDVMDDIIDRGHSRVLVYEEGKEKSSARHFFLVKHLIKLDPMAPTQIRKLGLIELALVSELESLFDLLNLFQSGSTHIAGVFSASDADVEPAQRELIGIITLEDILEVLICKEILDETDRVVKTDGIASGANLRQSTALDALIHHAKIAHKTTSELVHVPDEYKQHLHVSIRNVTDTMATSVPVEDTALDESSPA